MQLLLVALGLTTALMLAPNLSLPASWIHVGSRPCSKPTPSSSSSR